MNAITTHSAQWMSRPADERYTSLLAMQKHFHQLREASREAVVSSRRLTIVPASDSSQQLQVFGPNGHGYEPTHWSFGQLASLVKAPAGYLRSLPAPMAADCLNYGLKVARDIEDVGVLLHRMPDQAPALAAATGPKYGRIWNLGITRELVDQFGDGVTGDFRVPGTFKSELTSVTKENTSLFASDRDMFVFLADQEHRIEIPNRRNGESGSLARGFFVGNSEVGAGTLFIATFLFDYMCSNRMIWGTKNYKQVRIRHTAGAPDRWLEEVKPAIIQYANDSSTTIVKAIADARAKKIDKVADFLEARFSKAMSRELQAVHVAEEDRPIETLWDASVAVTAYAKTVKYQDERIALERIGGDIIDLAA